MADRDPQQEFSEQLPFLQNGTLDPARRQALKQWLSEHPEAQREYAFAERIRQQIKTSAAHRPADAGLPQLLASYRQTAPVPGFWSSVLDWLGGGIRVPAVAIALVALFVAGQTLWLVGQLPATQHGSTDQAAFENPQTPRPGLTVTFAPDARFANIRSTLAELDAQISDGPDPQGRLRITLPAGSDLASARQRLLGNKQIIRVDD